MNNRILTLKDFIKLQEELNEETVPGWQNKLNQNHFKTAIIDEVSELMNSVPWKWWKKQGEVDQWNFKIEVIDILHFVFSILSLQNIQYRNDDVSLGHDVTGFNRFINSHTGQLDYNVFIKNVHNLLECDSSYFVDEFVKDAGMNKEEVSAIYVAKRMLNYVRQRKGYKTGHYNKMPHGFEDNVYLRAIVMDFLDNPDLTLSDLQVSVSEAFS